MQASVPCQGAYTNPYETGQHSRYQLPEKKKIQAMMQNHRKHENKTICCGTVQTDVRSA